MSSEGSDITSDEEIEKIPIKTKKQQKTIPSVEQMKVKAISSSTSTKSSTKNMVDEALSELKTRKGVSLHAIKKYIQTKFEVDTEKINVYIKKYIKNSVENGTIVQTKGVGASGSFRLAPVKEKPKKIKKTIKKTKTSEKTKKKDKDDEVEVVKKKTDKKVKLPKQGSKEEKQKKKAKVKVKEDKSESEKVKVAKKKTTKKVQEKKTVVKKQKEKEVHITSTPKKRMKGSMPKRKSLGSIIRKPIMRPSLVMKQS